MLKNKRILFTVFVVIALFLIPSVCNAAATNATETTKTSTGETVKWSYELNEEGNIIKLLCTNKDNVSGNVVIPNTIDGKTVTQISTNNKGIFQDCLGITGVTIPNSVKNIEYSSFSGCKALKSVTIPNSVITIGRYAFEECLALTEINIPNSVITIEAYAFYKCNGLSKVTLSENLTVLNENVFSNCIGLTSVIIPKSVSTICGTQYDGAFYNCTNLEKVLIPDSVAAIEQYAFQNCNKLTIYGNDGKASKTYAEANNINFDYIANWDKAVIGKDNKPPKLESLKIVWSTAFEHDEGTGYYLASVGTNISIKATFDEKVYGKTSPILTIKCGNGDDIVINNGTIQGEYIIYTYRIQDKDKGIIAAVSLTGGDIADEAGNKIEKYTCPELITDVWGENVFANGVGSLPGNQGNQSNQNGNQQTVTLTSISITKAPTKINYTVGEYFDKKGIVVIATYSDGSKKEITDYSISPASSLKLTDKKVTVIYTENGVTETAEQKITVAAKVVSSPEDGENDEYDGYEDFEDDMYEDTTIKNDSKLPQTGATVISLLVIILLSTALISKVRYGKLKEI